MLPLPTVRLICALTCLTRVSVEVTMCGVYVQLCVVLCVAVAHDQRAFTCMHRDNDYVATKRLQLLVLN